MENHKVCKKILYYVDVKCVSPVCVSGGEEGLTDRDVLRDGNGTPFIAGSSLAGAMRSYLGYLKTENCIFGYATAVGTGGKMSSVFISDLEWRSAVTTAVRDGVKLSAEKTSVTGAKYDMEVVDTGAEGSFCMEVVVRQNDTEEEMKEQIAQALAGFESREIRLGGKKTRGYGEVQIMAVRCKEYAAENILEYREAYDPGSYRELPDRKENILAAAKAGRQYIHIQVPLKLQGGISVRRYSAKKGEPDYVHMTASGKPVIPGTSFNGAIRHRTSEILQELEVPHAQQLQDVMYGYVEKKVAHRSAVVIGECVIEGGVPLTMVRNAISRFEGAARDGALYKERSHFQGTTELNIYVQRGIRMLKQDKTAEVDITEYVIGILLIALKDLQKGYLPVGGQTAIGRGILLADGEITIDGSAQHAEKFLADCMKIKEVLA